MANLLIRRRDGGSAIFSPLGPGRGKGGEQKTLACVSVMHFCDSQELKRALDQLHRAKETKKEEEEMEALGKTFCGVAKNELNVRETKNFLENVKKYLLGVSITFMG